MNISVLNDILKLLPDSYDILTNVNMVDMVSIAEKLGIRHAESSLVPLNSVQLTDGAIPIKDSNSNTLYAHMTPRSVWLGTSIDSDKGESWIVSVDDEHQATCGHHNSNGHTMKINRDQFVHDSIARLEAVGCEINSVKRSWFGTDPNYIAYQERIRDGLTPVQAVQRIPMGKLLGSIGFREVSNNEVKLEGLDSTILTVTYRKLTEQPTV